MIDLRRSGQGSFGEGFIAEETANLWEPWMRQADQVREDEQLVKTVYEALLKRRPKSRTRGRRGVAAEIVLRLIGAQAYGTCLQAESGVRKRIRNWSFAEVEREVRPQPLVPGVHAC